MINLPEPRRIALDSGAILLYQRNSVSPTTAFGVWIRKGSRDEGAGERGMSHVLEHMVFRGTPSRSGLDIALELESIGGQWDAFTSKEAVCYSGRTLEEHFPRLADVFSDIALHPLIEPPALRTELKVIREEIRSVNDSPEEAVYELFFRGLFGGSQLGHPVAGNLRDISRMDRDGLLSFHRKTYTAANTVFAYIGTLPPGRVARILDRRFEFQLKGRRPGTRRDRFMPAVSRSARKNGWSQYHVCIGARTVPAGDPMRFAVMLLSGIVGGGVSSRLFQSMRERTGLAYSVYSHVNFWSDTGAFSVYFSVDPRNLKSALEIFDRDMEKIRSSGITAEELESARAQLKGSIIFSLESSETRLFRLFHEECYLGEFRKVEDVLRDIDAVDAAMVGEAAGKLLAPSHLIRAVSGPEGAAGRKSSR
jgi:predicted Zn-dependent peptidase